MSNWIETYVEPYLPRFLEAWFHEQPVDECLSGSALDRRLCKASHKKDKHPDKYAVLISGDNAYDFMEDLSANYRTLQSLGFERGNIYILDKEGKENAACFNARGEVLAQYPSDGIASKENIEKLFEVLSHKIDSHDLLLVYTSDHGDRLLFDPESPANQSEPREKQDDIKISALCLNGYGSGQYITEIDMSRYLDAISPKLGILVFTQCYGGGFAARMGHGRYIGVSASGADQMANNLHSFGTEFLNAFINNQTDNNHDGKISIKEAFDHAYKIGYGGMFGESQTPQIFSDIDTDSLFLGN